MTDSMRNLFVVPAVVMFAITSGLAGAQQAKISSEQQQAVMEAGRLINSPVEFVLRHREVLQLTSAQIANLEKLGVALADSSAARTARMSRDVRASSGLAGMAKVVEWEGEVDEAAIRAALVKQSELQAQLMIGTAKDRRAVAALLTPQQRSQLPQLQNAEMMKAARARGR